MFKSAASYQTVLVTYLSADNIMLKIGVNVPIWLIVVALVSAVLLNVIVQWSIGLWWDKHQVFDQEQDWQNKRNPMQKAISKRLLDNDGFKDL